MDASDFRKVLESHGDAIVAGDQDRALEDFAEELRPAVIASAGDMPRPLVDAEILKVVRDGELWVVHIRYVAEGAKESVTIESVWDESLSDRPLIIEVRPI